MARILTLSLLSGVLAVVLAAAAMSLTLPRLAAAQGDECSMDWLDQNCNGSIDIADLFTVIDLYFSGDPIPATEPDPAPPSGGDKWVRVPVTSTVDGLGLVNSVEDGPIYGPWYLSLECNAAGNPGVFIWSIPHWIFGSDWGEFREMSIKTVVGDVSQSDAWYYFPPEAEGGRADYFTYRFDESLISAMLDADEMTVTIPFQIPSTVTFPIGGLSEHIAEPSDICTEFTESTSE